MTAREPVDYILGQDFLRALHEAGLLPEWPMLERVIIDVVPGEIVRMHVQRIGSRRLVDVVVAAGPRIEITDQHGGTPDFTQALHDRMHAVFVAGQGGDRCPGCTVAADPRIEVPDPS